MTVKSRNIFQLLEADDIGVRSKITLYMLLALNGLAKMCKHLPYGGNDNQFARRGNQRWQGNK